VFFLGWLNTYEEYFIHATKDILDTMIKILDQNSKYKFIWAEMSFLSLWWDQAEFNQRKTLKKLIHNRQFEIVTGGWVSEQSDSREIRID
jgi:alpha-mannosidase II